MKIRNGFVSNSSSSSFVVAFPRRPKSAEDVREILFGDLKHFPPDARVNHEAMVLELDGDELIRAKERGVYLTKQIAQTVWEDLKPQRANCKRRIKETFRYSEYISFDKFRKPGSSGNYDDIDWKAHERAQEAIDQRNYTDAMRQFEGQLVYLFSYADENGSYFSVMEHGGIFNKLPHEQISNH